MPPPEASTHDDGPLGAVGRIAAGAATQDDLAWLSNGFATWLTARGAIPVERCLRLPSSEPRIALAERDLWLRRAALVVAQQLAHRGAPGSARAVADELARRWARFISDGPWRFRREQGLPGGELPELHVALYHATRANDGQALTADRLRKGVLGRESAVRCPTTSRMLTSDAR